MKKYLIFSKNFKKFQKKIFFFNTELVFAKLPPLTLHNLLADRPAPRGAAGGAGGGPPRKSKNTTFKIFKKKATTTLYTVRAIENLVQNQSSISAVFPIVRFAGDQKTNRGIPVF